MGGYDITQCIKDNEAYGVYWNGGATDNMKKTSCCIKNMIFAIDETNAGYILRVADDKA